MNGDLVEPRSARRGLAIVGASAGSGKTHRLTSEVLAALTSATGAIEPEALVAVTYTRRAQVELEERLRRALLAHGDADRAAKLPMAYLGTVHAVALRWLRERALEAGVSPDVSVLADGGASLREALEQCVRPEIRAQLGELAERLEVGLEGRTGRVDWEPTVSALMELSRHGRIDPGALPAMAERSIARYAAALRPPVGEPFARDAELVLALERARARVRAEADLTVKRYQALVETLDRAYGDARVGRLAWGRWFALSRLDVSVKVRPLVDDLVRVAGEVGTHPSLHEDLFTFTRLAYAAAAEALDAHAAWKRERGLVDYVDMIDHGLTLLDDPGVAAELSEELGLVVVDELQDSSPIQLAMFLRLHAIAGRSCWVGDAKQCIFEYAGADPRMMDGVLQWSRRGAGGPASTFDATVEQLPLNRRSRPALVELVNDVFVAALRPHGMAAEEIAVRAAREEPDALAALPPVGVFAFTHAHAGAEAAHVARGVARLLAAPDATPVIDRARGSARPLAAGDVAVLVATNDCAEAIAEALSRLGVRAAIARRGLLATPEGRLVGAALRYVVDPGDRLARAELDALHGWNGGSASTWLADELEGTERVPAWRARLDALRAREGEAQRTPPERLDAVLVALDAAALAAAFPDPSQSLANLDALRRFARAYTDGALAQGDAPTLAGLVRAWAEPESIPEGDAQYAGHDAGSVTIVTYHRSKGLEWPVVVLASLDRAPRRSVFEPCPETDVATLDPTDPLRGRWLRFWPGPCSPSRSAPLLDRVGASPEGMECRAREARERARLLYVGFTRARDHLILSVRETARGRRCTAWLDELRRADGRAVIGFGRDALEVTPASGEARTVPARVFRLDAATAAEPIAGAPARRRAFSVEPTRDRPRPDYVVRPSSATDLALPELTIASIDVVHAPLVDAREARARSRAGDWDALGDALHAFLAAPADAAPPPAWAPYRFDVARDRFRAYVDARLPGASWRSEIPVQVRLPTPDGERAIDGRIDLLLETETELVVVDHKSFPAAGERVWRAKATELAPQLATYLLALSRTTSKPASAWLHFATAGAVVQLGWGRPLSS